MRVNGLESKLSWFTCQRWCPCPLRAVGACCQENRCNVAPGRQGALLSLWTHWETLPFVAALSRPEICRNTCRHQNTLPSSDFQGAKKGGSYTIFWWNSWTNISCSQMLFHNWQHIRLIFLPVTKIHIQFTKFTYLLFTVTLSESTANRSSIVLAKAVGVTWLAGASMSSRARFWPSAYLTPFCHPAESELGTNAHTH